MATLFYRKFWVPSHIYAKINLSWWNIVFTCVLLFCVLPSTSFSFLKSLASSCILLSLCPEWQSLISNSSPAALHSGHQTWFEIQMLTLSFLSSYCVTWLRKESSRAPIQQVFQTLLRKQNKRASPEIQKPHKIRSCTHNPKHEQRNNSVVLINKGNKYWTNGGNF